MIAKCASCGTKNRIDPTAAKSQQPVCGKCGEVLELGAAVSPETAPVVVTDASFDQEVVATSNRVPVMVDAWAEWCGPCRMVAPTLEQLARESAGRYRIAKLDVDANPRTAAAFRIASIPTMLIFKNGQLVDRIVGVQSKQTLATKLSQVAA